MRRYYLIVCVVFGCIATTRSGYAQARAVLLTGDTCVGGVLKASLTAGAANTIKWFKDTTLLTVRSKWQRYGVVVAGTGTPGANADQLYEPHGIYIDKNKNLYIVDDGRQSVVKWAPGATSGVTVAGGNGKGSALNQFYTPSDVVVDNNKNVYVSDDLTNSVRKWAPGAKTGVIAAGGHGEGAATNQLNGPQSICIDRFGNLYIVDRWNARVQKWSPGAVSGITVAGGNGRGDAPNQLYEPSGVGVDYAGNVYVSEPYKNRITKWMPGTNTGAIVAGGNGAGMAANQLTFPGEMSVDSAGNIYVLDGGQRVQKWSPGATYGITVAGGYGYDGTGAQLDRISTSAGLFVDAAANIYVSDLFQGRVRKFAKGIISEDELNNATTGTYRVEIANLNDKVFISKPLHVAEIPVTAPVITGKIRANSNKLFPYSVDDYMQGVTYTWSVSGGGIIKSGQGSPVVMVQWGTNANESISVIASNACGISKMRVKNVEISNKTTTATANAGNKSELTIYPNPATRTASISFTSAKQTTYEVTLTNMMGKRLMKQQGVVYAGKNKIDLDVALLNKDLYVINIKYDNILSQLKLQKQ